jgi:predicted Rossmann fold flavoprotein
MKNKTYDAIVLGGGAAGLFCAITAAKKGNKVLVLEKSNKLGKKILMSGGGRCNFTNFNVQPEYFLSENEHFCKSALSKYSAQDFISLVESYNIDYETKKHGQLFCINSAKDIVNMLISECDKYKVEIRKYATAKEVNYFESDSLYKLNVLIEDKDKTEYIQYESKSLVVATGALSVPSLGGSGYGYELANQFGLGLIDLRAGLVPFMFSDYMKPICENLSGVSHSVEISCNNKTFHEDMLFTHRGLSGPAVLQISSYWNLGDKICINLLPSIDVSDYVKKIKSQNPKILLKSLLNKHLPKALVIELEILLWKNLINTPIGEWSNSQIEQVGTKLNNWFLKPSSTEGYRTAEVTLGGVNTDFISSKTMEVLDQKDLYFIGEVLDVTGHLGGFNFQWAWASAYVAGLEI